MVTFSRRLGTHTLVGRTAVCYACAASTENAAKQQTRPARGRSRIRRSIHPGLQDPSARAAAIPGARRPGQPHRNSRPAGRSLATTGPRAQPSRQLRRSTVGWAVITVSLVDQRNSRLTHRDRRAHRLDPPGQTSAAVDSVRLVARTASSPPMSARICGEDLRRACLSLARWHGVRGQSPPEHTRAHDRPLWIYNRSDLAQNINDLVHSRAGRRGGLTET
jgi:hypothetical protein